MRKLLFLWLLLPLAAIAQNADSVWIVSNYTKQEVMIPMRDGVRLFTAIYTPKDRSEKHPILINRTPYTAAPYGEGLFRNFWANHYKEYLKEGYIMVIQDVRGRWMSEGKFEDVRPFNPDKKKKDIDEASDTYDTIDWLIKNISNNNGNAGVFGISYPGFYATEAALSKHPALKMVSPQAPVTDWFIGDDFHHNGTFMLMDAFSFYRNFGRPRPTPTTYQTENKDIFYTKDSYKFFLETGALSNFSKLMGDSIPFWTDLMNHPNYDDWWKQRNARNGCYTVQPNMLIVGGLFDAEDCFGAWNLYKAIDKQSPFTNNKIVMGPWFHGQWAGRGTGNGSFLGNVQFDSKTSEYYAHNIEIPYFNYYLKGKGVDQLPKATIFFTGENKWHQFKQWPPASVKWESWFLSAGNKLINIPTPDTTVAYDEYVSDPAKPVPYTDGIHFTRTREYMTDDQRFAARRPDVLVYESKILEEDITLGGPVIADLLVSINTTDADFVVKLIDVFPDDFSYSGIPATTEQTIYPMNGYQMLVRGEIMRGRYRNSFEQPEAFEPNKPTHVKFTLPDVAHTFKKGHRIMVQVQSSWFPLADRNPQQFIDIYHCKDSDFQKANIRIYHNYSRVILPIL